LRPLAAKSFQKTIFSANCINLPPGVASILTRPRSYGNFTFVPERGVLEDEIPADGAVEGFVRVSVEVEDP
jgi:hypothetical protein